MASIRHLSLLNKPTHSQPSLNSNNKHLPLVSLWLTHGYLHISKKPNIKQSSSSYVIYAVDKDSSQYEIDQEKAKEALKKLDQQLQDLSAKQVSPPKVKASSVKITRDSTTEDEVSELPGSFFAFLATGLFIFTIFYNILYITVIDPSY